jgi:hypothetical protein
MVDKDIEILDLYCMFIFEKRLFSKSKQGIIIFIDI